MIRYYANLIKASIQARWHAYNYPYQWPYNKLSRIDVRRSGQQVYQAWWDLR